VGDDEEDGIFVAVIEGAVRDGVGESVEKGGFAGSAGDGLDGDEDCFGGDRGRMGFVADEDGEAEFQGELSAATLDVGGEGGVVGGGGLAEESVGEGLFHAGLGEAGEGVQSISPSS
jgi:hypothetical protein